MSKGRTLKSLMTEDERALYRKHSDQWGGAEDAALRGAAFLDREMPGWADRVEVKTLDLGSTGRCVLGQIFDSEYKQSLKTVSDLDRHQWPRSLTVFNGYAFGQKALGLLVESTRTDVPADPVATFFGFDDGFEYTYDILTDAWTPLIAERKTQVTA